jgi:uncharacterized protein
LDAKPELLLNGPEAASTCIALAHGAGAGMATHFMNDCASGLADSGFHVVRFEFPYMASRNKTGKKRPPDREPALRETWLEVVEMLRRKRLVIGGKSMGGRIASLVADEAQVAGLVCPAVCHDILDFSARIFAMVAFCLRVVPITCLLHAPLMS